MQLLPLLALLGLVSGGLVSRGDRLALRRDDIAAINNLHLGWTAGHNKRFANMTLDDVAHTLGKKQRFGKALPTLPYLGERALASVPATFDSRTQWSSCSSITTVRDQSQCGACWAFSTAEAFNDRLCISAGYSGPLISPTEILACCNAAHAASYGSTPICPNSNGCDGGYIEEGVMFIIAYGVVTGNDFGSPTSESCQPYPFSPYLTTVPATPACVTTCGAGYPVSWANDRQYGDNGYTVSQYSGSTLNIASTVAAAKAEILARGSIIAGFTVWSDFMSYTSGIYVKSPTATEVGGHAVVVIGWGDSPSPYWIAKNQWGVSWGMSGFFYIAMGVNEVGFEGEMVAVTVATPTPTPTPVSLSRSPPATVSPAPTRSSSSAITNTHSRGASPSGSAAGTATPVSSTTPAPTNTVFGFASKSPVPGAGINGIPWTTVGVGAGVGALLLFICCAMLVNCHRKQAVAVSARSNPPPPPGYGFSADPMQPVPPPAYAPGGGVKWTCPRCTLENVAGLVYCEACGSAPNRLSTPAPASVAVPVRIARQNSTSAPRGKGTQV